MKNNLASLLLVTTFLAVSAVPGQAMNQEGHDEAWILDFPPARALMEAIPEARPLPSLKCPVSEDAIAANPYEQIQLPRHRCPAKIKLKALPVAGTEQ